MMYLVIHVGSAININLYQRDSKFLFLAFGGLKAWGETSCTVLFSLIIKITISSIVIGLKKPYFPLIHSPSCYGQFVI